MKPLSNPLSAPDNAAARPTPPVKPAAPPASNAKPDKNQNQGASPAMMGDRQRIVAPKSPAIASTPSTPATQRGQSYKPNGMDSAMGALADKMHPPKRR